MNLFRVKVEFEFVAYCEEKHARLFAYEAANEMSLMEIAEVSPLTRKEIDPYTLKVDPYVYTDTADIGDIRLSEALQRIAEAKTQEEGADP
jgi:hypothetical protein